MDLIAFCAVDLVENVTNAQPVGGGTVGEGGKGGTRRNKTRQKVWTTRYEPQKNTLQYREWQLPSTQNHPHWLAHGERTEQGEQ